MIPSFLLTLAASIFRELTIDDGELYRAHQLLRLYQVVATDQQRVELDQRLEQGLDVREWANSKAFDEFLLQHGEQVRQWEEQRRAPSHSTLAMVMVDVPPSGKRPRLRAGTVVDVGSVRHLGFVGPRETHKATIYWTPRGMDIGFQINTAAWILLPLDDQAQAKELRDRQRFDPRQSAFPEYNLMLHSQLKAEYDRLENEIKGNQWGPRPVSWKPASVDRPELLERQYAIKTELGSHLWQRPYSQVGPRLDMPRKQHQLEVVKALKRGDYVPDRVLQQYPNLWQQEMLRRFRR